MTEDNAKLEERFRKILQAHKETEDEELKRIIQSSGKQVTDAQKEELRKVLRNSRITKAPPPIKPVSGLGGYIPPQKTKPDYDHWTKLECWTLQEAACLLCDQSPKQHRMPSGVKQEIQEVYELLERSFLAGELNSVRSGYFKQNDIKKWVTARDMNIPQELLKQVALHKKPSAEHFIKSLRVYPESNYEIKIQQPGKEAKPKNHKDLGFRNTETNEWKTFLDILQKYPHVFKISPDSKRKQISEIGRKLIKFFNKEFEINIPQNFKMYERDLMDEGGIYRFKFKVIIEKPEPSKYNNFSKDRLIEEICNLFEEYQRLKNENSADPDSRNKPELNVVEDNLSLASKIAMEKGYLTKKEIKDILMPEKEDIRFDPYENKEDV